MRLFGWLLLFAVFFATAGSALIHLGNHYYFLSSILTYQLVNDRAAVYLAALLPHLELTLAVAVWFPELRSASLLLMAATFTAYAAAQGTALAKGLEISCGCFGPSSDEPISTQSVAFAGGMAAAALLCFTLFTMSERTKRRGSHGHASPDRILAP